MKLNKNDLRKMQYDFNSISNRLLQADFSDYTAVLKKFLNYIDETPIISEYIVTCGECDWNIADEVQEVQSSYGRCIFSTGDTDEEEVRNISAVLHYLVKTNNSIYHRIAMGYSSSNQYQDRIKGFNERFVMVLIRHIERYLTKVGIDMGLDDKVVYNVTVQNGQAIIATDNATVTASNNVGVDDDELRRLISDVKSVVDSLSPEDQETVSDCLDVVESETLAEKPKKGLLRTALNTLKTIKGVAEFSAAVAALLQFAGQCL